MYFSSSPFYFSRNIENHTHMQYMLASFLEKGHREAETIILLREKGHGLWWRRFVAENFLRTCHTLYYLFSKFVSSILSSWFLPRLYTGRDAPQDCPGPRRAWREKSCAGVLETQKICSGQLSENMRFHSVLLFRREHFAHNIKT